MSHARAKIIKKSPPSHNKPTTVVPEKINPTPLEGKCNVSSALRDIVLKYTY
jgi:hypothetical protein